MKIGNSLPEEGRFLWPLALITLEKVYGMAFQKCLLQGN